MIHKEGVKISLVLFLVLIILNFLFYYFISILAGWTVTALSILLMAFILRFFRNPGRTAEFSAKRIYCPADGKVVVIEETEEGEYFMDRRIQVSIFMSVWNVHINWYPVGGRLTYYKYHPGKYLVARHPKSSVLNERNTIVLENVQGEEILVRQIAGIVARRIISYAAPEKEVIPGDEMGFIRFGSRVDVFLPLNSKILVETGQKVRGLATALAELE